MSNSRVRSGQDQDPENDIVQAPPSGSDRHVQLKGQLRGRSYQDQVAMLAPVQAKGGAPSGDTHAIAANGLQGSGQSLPHLDAIQRSFGDYDVGGVSAHVGGAAAAANRAMGAEAYASGEAVAFRAPPSLHTAAHEAAHVVQQRAGVALKDGVGQAGDAYEQHADSVADKVVKGESAQGLLGQKAGSSASRGLQHSKRASGSSQPGASVQRFVRIGNTSDKPWLRSPAKQYTSKNLDEIDEDFAAALGETGWPQPTRKKVLDALKAQARKSKRFAYANFAHALKAVGGKQITDLSSVGVVPRKIGEPGSEEPFAYSKSGQAHDHLNEKFDEGHLPWTHNTGPDGLLGIMLSGVMAPGSEESINFRYDIDNRYHQGVTIVMKPGLYKCFESQGAWIEDLYSQHKALGLGEGVVVGRGHRTSRKVKPEHEKPLLDMLTGHAGFRSEQIKGPGGTHKQKKVPIIASHNPQLRIPFVIAVSHIDFVIMTRPAWRKLSRLVLTQNARAIIGANDFRRGSSQSAVLGQALTKGAYKPATQRLLELSQQGGIIVDGSRKKVDWAHEAGRMVDRTGDDESAINEAAEAGLEAGEGFGAPMRENNSPRALGMATFERFQQIFYARLAERDNATGKVAAAILKGKKPLVLTYQKECQPLLGVNNCLINAIARGGGRANATIEELVLIRAVLDNIGQQMAADPVNVDTIRQALGVTRPVIVRYPSTLRPPYGEYVDEIHAGAGAPITIYHDGVNHFQHTPAEGLTYDNGPPQPAVG